MQREHRVEVAEPQVPAALALLAVAEADRAVRDRRARRSRRRARPASSRRARSVAEVGGHQEAARDVRAVALLELDEQRQVGESLAVVREARDRAVDPGLLEHHVPHRHRERRVGAGLRRQPVVGELHMVGVVGRDDDDLLAAVARLGHEMGVRRARDRQVRAPHDQIARIPPVGRLGHIGLVAEHLRRRRRQVGVPVIERRRVPADQRQEARAGDERHGRHRRDRREAANPVRAVLTDRVHGRGGDQLGRLLPTAAHETAPAALPAIARRPPRPARMRPPGPGRCRARRASARAGSHARTGNGAGPANTCTRRTTRRAGSRAARDRGGRDPCAGSQPPATPR